MSASYCLMYIFYKYERHVLLGVYDMLHNKNCIELVSHGELNNDNN